VARRLPRIFPNAATVVSLLSALCSCHTATVRVVDADTGNPIAGAAVEHGYQKDPSWVTVLISAAVRKHIPIETLATGADGRAVISDVRPGHYLSIRPPAQDNSHVGVFASYDLIGGWRIVDERAERQDGCIVMPLSRMPPATRPGENPPGAARRLFCPHCGYRLQGTPDHCPDCGRALPAPPGPGT
jgi:hypothetical protein